ncbi:hypothetical protein ACFQLX_02690 [Streptomyces polyrhachis]|uniref:DUF3618 domain-containing protein n=1 Tax=Streptomyces polyrhachis TaxID=1282885 RepID=A0ABW2G8Q3_9ACTN
MTSEMEKEIRETRKLVEEVKAELTKPPSRAEVWSSVVGLDKAVKPIIDHKWEMLGVAVAAAIVALVTDFSAIKPALLSKFGGQQVEGKIMVRKIPERTPLPVTRADIQSMKEMQSQAMGLVRSIHSLTSEIRAAARAAA